MRENIENAQKDDKNAMMNMINQFNYFLKKWAKWLNYEDAYEDLVLCFIVLIKKLDLNRFYDNSDGAIVSYITVSIKNFCYKKIGFLINKKKELLFCTLDDEGQSPIQSFLKTYDEYNIFDRLGLDNILNQNEYRLIIWIFYYGYTFTDIAKSTGKTRQAVNQLKIRALEKIKKYMFREGIGFLNGVCFLVNNLL